MRSARTITPKLIPIVVALLLVGCTPAPPPTPTPQPLSSYLRRAVTQIEADPAAAIDILEEAARTHPNSPVPMTQIGQIYLTQRQWRLAQDSFNRALAREPDYAAALAGLAETALQQGRAGEALTHWQRAAAIDPATPEIFSGMGRAYLAQLNVAEAQAAFEQQLAYSDSGEARWYLAALLAPTDLAEARQQLAAIPSSVPADLLARRDYLAEILAQFAGDATAVDQAEVARAVGIGMVQAEAWPLAIQALTIAAGLPAPATERAETLAFLGHALAQAGRPAFDRFTEAEELDPDSALPAYFQAIYLRQQRAFQAAEAQLRRAIALDEHNPVYFVELARIYSDQGNLTAAEQAYMQAVEAAPDDIQIQLLQAQFYANRAFKLAEAGIPAAEALVERDGSSGAAHDVLGWMQFLAGEYDAAEEHLRRAVELEPALMSAHYHLARYLEAQGVLEEAISHYQVVAKQDFSSGLADRALEDLQRVQRKLKAAGGSLPTN